MPNYFNPNSFNPGTDFKPNSALGGMMWAEDRNRYNKLADMFQQSQGYDLAKQGMETSEFMADAPIRQLAGQSKAAGYQADIATKVPRAQADLQSVLGQNETRNLTNQSTRATQPSAIAKTIAENVASKGKSEFEEYARGWQKAQGLAAEADQIDPSWRLNGRLPVSIMSQLDPKDPMQRNLIQTPLPGKVLEAIVEASPEMIREMAKLRQQGSNQLANTSLQNQSQERIANIQAGPRYAEIAARTEREKELKKIELEIARLGKLDSEGRLDAVGQKYLKFLLDREFRLKQAGAMVAPGVGAAMIGGETGNRMQGALTGPASLPSAGGQQSQPQSFPDEASALASGVKGIVIINGRRARID